MAEAAVTARAVARVGFGPRGLNAHGVSPRGDRSANLALASELSVVLVRGERRQRQRMDARRQFVGQCLVDEPLARHAALSDKGGGGDRNGEMRLASGARSFVPDMEMRLVLDLETGRSKPLGQLAADRVGN